MPRASKFDWPKMEADFLASPTVTLKELSIKYKVAYGLLWHKQDKLKWGEKRERLAKKATEKTIERVSDALSLQSAQQVKLGNLLVGKGVQAIQEKNKTPKTFSEAQSAIVTGVNITRKALNMDAENERKPVNIQINIVGLPPGAEVK